MRAREHAMGGGKLTYNRVGQGKTLLGCMDKKSDPQTCSIHNNMYMHFGDPKQAGGAQKARHKGHVQQRYGGGDEWRREGEKNRSCSRSRSFVGGAEKMLSGLRNKYKDWGDQKHSECASKSHEWGRKKCLGECFKQV